MYSASSDSAQFIAPEFFGGDFGRLSSKTAQALVDLLNANAQPMINSDAWEASREPKIPFFGSRLRRYEARY
jgi:hypothetical protein